MNDARVLQRTKWMIAGWVVFALAFGEVPFRAIAAAPTAAAPSLEDLPPRPAQGDPREEASDVASDGAAREFGAKEIAATSALVESLQVADWLGPLAPLALSPFFGVALLSGLSLWGPEWIADNALLSSAGPLHHRGVFWIFLALTVATSVPRLTKVSKPFAQAVDQLEAYSVIVILLTVKLLSSLPVEIGVEDVEAAAGLRQAGVVSFTLEALLAVAMVINLLVINSVKFFFELLVWLTPIPALDAVFEVCNKTCCAMLMMIYAFSPTLATVINLVLLVLAAIVLRWVGRHVRFYRAVLLDPIIASIWKAYGETRRGELIVFPKNRFGPFAPRTRLRMRRSGEAWHFAKAEGWLPANNHTITAIGGGRIRRGWISHVVEIRDPEGQEQFLVLSRRFDRTLETLARELALAVVESDADARVGDTNRLRAELRS